MVEMLLGLVIPVEEAWCGEVNEDIVPLEDAPDDVIEDDIIEEDVIEEPIEGDVEYPDDVSVFETVDGFIPVNI